MNASTDHKPNVNAIAGITRGVRAAACRPMTGLAEFTDGSLAVRCMR